MAGNYGPEIKASMQNPVRRPSQVKKGGETPADRIRDARRGIKEGSPQDLKLDAQPANQAPPAQVLPPGGPPAGGQVPPHVAAAAGIAHAILANRGM
jgi:hypothetical protein